MISSKLLRGLKDGDYYIYDDLYVYTLTKLKDKFWLRQYGSSIYSAPYFYIYEKDLENLELEAYGDSDTQYHLKYEYDYRGYTNSWKASSSVGYMSLHSDFSWYKLKFYGKCKSDNVREEVENFRKIFKKQYWKETKNFKNDWR